MDENEFRKTNVKVACVFKMDLEAVASFKEEILDIVKKHDAKIIYHTVSPYKLVIMEEKGESKDL
jgi:hypothetical protein